MKIDIVSLHTDPLAGNDDTQTVLIAELARELGRQGHQVTMHTRRTQPGDHEPARIAERVTVERVTAGPQRPLDAEAVLAHLPAFGDHLARRWAENAPDVVHAYGWMSGLAALAARNGTPVPVVQSYHSLGVTQPHLAGGPAPAPRIRLERALGRSVDAVIAGSQEEKDELLKLGLARSCIAVVPPGIDVETFTEKGPAQPRSDRKRLLMLSRQGAGTAIAALAYLPDAELVISGGPPLEEERDDAITRRLRSLAEGAGVTDRTIFLGRVPRTRVPALLRSTDLVLALSAYEPCGLIPLEAMACGVPVVATAVGAHLDIVIDEVTGRFVPPGEPVELARVLRPLLADRTRLAALSVGAADRARSRHTWQRVAAETTAVYERAGASGDVPAIA